MTRPPKETQGEPPPRRNRAQSVGRDAGFAGAAAFARAGFTDPALVLRWTEIVGKDVARIARPLRFSEKDGTLTLLAEPGAALFLGHESRALAERINTYLGRSAVTRVKFAQGRLSVPAPLSTPAKAAKKLDPGDPALTYQGPDRLKDALQKLAHWRAGRTAEAD